MEVIEAIATRRSVRAYTEEKVTERELDALLQAAYASPVAGGNRSKMRATVVRDAGLLEAMRAFIKESTGMKADPFYGASTLVVLMGEEDLGDAALFTNAGCILENVQLAAHAMGLGACISWACGTVVPASPELVEALQVPDGFKLLAGVEVGHPAKFPPERKAQPRFETTFVG